MHHPISSSKYVQSCVSDLVSVCVLLGERSEPHTGVFNRDFA